MELIVEEIEWVPRDQRSLGASLVALKIDWNECDLRRVVRTTSCGVSGRAAMIQ